MRVVGVIAEYDPFHRGHARQLAEAKRLAGADKAVVVMSGGFTQRGAAALLCPADRARMALACGADAVFALPVLWSVADAERFAMGGVSLLTSLGVDALSFGAETPDREALARAARLLEEPPARLTEALRALLAAGRPYPEAMGQAVAAEDPALGELLRSPNNTLAVCYLRAAMRLNSPMEFYPVARTGAYHDASLVGEAPSATALREAILRGDWAGAEAAMTPEAFAVLKDAAAHGRIHRPDALDKPLLYRLRSMSDAELRRLPGVSEGIEKRLRNAAQTAVTREELLQTAKTRRYPYTRLARLCAHALLDVTDDMMRTAPLPPAAWLLGLRSDAGPLMTRLRRSGFPILAKAAAADRQADWFQAECRAYDAWTLGAGMPPGLAFQQGVAVVPGTAEKPRPRR